MDLDMSRKKADTGRHASRADGSRLFVSSNLIYIVVPFGLVFLFLYVSCFLIDVDNVVFWCIWYRIPFVDIILCELGSNKEIVPHFLKVTP
jgi:hypothetical protein